MARVLVTGGAGFIGSHLCEYLLEGHEVICVDNLITGSKHNIGRLMGNHNFEFIRHDVTQPLFVEVDEIYHLASIASPKFYRRNPIQTVKTNVFGTYNMLGLAKRTGAKILLASTSEVYGDPTVHPQPESYRGRVDQLGERACYAESKRIAETLMEEYHREHSVDIRVARIFNTYGPYMAVDDGRVVSNFIVQALYGNDVTVNGDGKQTRSFCYVYDIVSGLMDLMDSQYSLPVNFGCPEETPIIQLAEKIISMTKSKSEVVFRTSVLDEPMRRCPQIETAYLFLKWKPTVSLDEGLERTIKYFEEKI